MRTLLTLMAEWSGDAGIILDILPSWNPNAITVNGEFPAHKANDA